MLISELLIKDAAEETIHGCLSVGESVYAFTLTPALDGNAFFLVNGGQLGQFAFNASEDFPITELEFWRLFIQQKPILTCNSQFGVAEMNVAYVGFNYTVEELPEVPHFESLSILHKYRTFPITPSKRVNLRVKWNHKISVGKMLSVVGPLSLEFKFDSMTIREHGVTTSAHYQLAFNYQGMTDTRHQTVNERLFSAFGPADEFN